MLLHHIITALLVAVAPAALTRGGGEFSSSPPLLDALCEPECSHQPVLNQEPDEDPESIETVEDLLDALESADADLASFSAVVKYIKEDLLLDDVQERRGTLYYRVAPETAQRQFAVLFTRLRFGKEWHDDLKDYVFDGRFLIERLHQEHQFFKREVVRPGETYDPLSIDGPFPLPIGQKKADLLRRFEATLLDPSTEGRLAGNYHMLLTARDRSDDDRLETVELWYDRETLLPTKAVVTEKTGDLSTVELANPARNPAELDQSVFSTQTPDPLDGWTIEISHLSPEQGGLGHSQKPRPGDDGQ
ncbi:MAG: outer membrane lipoprotein carrier protein LolA [Planctomycetes bacterium]|nr:outer membrane lipoprotein carrier protein LolA [Planctomycetota bacterium]NOG53911.1 outer membrane lipoprotein carrier protein LolA [Planctomycetota bacterium]